MMWPRSKIIVSVCVLPTCIHVLRQNGRAGEASRVSAAVVPV